MGGGPGRSIFLKGVFPMLGTFASKGPLGNGKDALALKNILPRKSPFGNVTLPARGRTVADPAALFGARGAFAAGGFTDFAAFQGGRTAACLIHVNAF
jgi:hypothetical protein